MNKLSQLMNTSDQPKPSLVFITGEASIDQVIERIIPLIKQGYIIRVFYLSSDLSSHFSNPTLKGLEKDFITQLKTYYISIDSSLYDPVVALEMIESFLNNYDKEQLHFFLSDQEEWSDCIHQQLIFLGVTTHQINLLEIAS
ncbi:hypothetical protein [Siphonobacter sp. SORGH_AS_1065]|uniref:hypothetical protein n=1 Tax=Siphonobacter sp. SORGH_AS_1065 TaxID=3041795 RepID=UPI00277F87C9|nr:hypothetical protein [Siphonobacter sp. SORGH_AS_1065]MDQ1086359.1 hypothetical protein [Siphonobacter sp. SORGH_AS_1065]